MKRLRFGIIGCSGIAERSVIPAIISSRYSQIEIFGSRDKKKALDFSQKFSSPKFGNYNDVIEDKNVDIIYISTPNALHAKFAKKALENGKHVYVEKSAFANYKITKQIIKIAQKNETRIMEGFMFRYHPQHNQVNKLIKNNMIGKIKLFSGSFGFPKFPKNNIRYNKELGGGFLNDAGCYPISAARMIFRDEPISVTAKMINDKKFGVDIEGASIMQFKGGKMATITYGHERYYQSSYSVWGSNGIIILERAYSIPYDFKAKIQCNFSNGVKWEDRKQKEIFLKPSNHFKNMIEDFCKEIIKGKKSKKDFESEIINQGRVMQAHRDSASKGKEIFIEDL